MVDVRERNEARGRSKSVKWPSKWQWQWRRSERSCSSCQSKDCPAACGGGEPGGAVAVFWYLMEKTSPKHHYSLWRILQWSWWMFPEEAAACGELCRSRFILKAAVCGKNLAKNRKKCKEGATERNCLRLITALLPVLLVEGSCRSWEWRSEVEP